MFVRAFSHPYPAVQFGKHIRVPSNNCINSCCLVADMAGPDSRVPESFAAMNSGDVESIGRHCQMEYCGKLDLLPFLCRNCNRSVGQATYRRLPQSNTRSVFCLDHRTESSHKCPCPGKAARLAQRNQAEGALGSSAPTTQTFGQSLPESQCAATSCTILIDGSRVHGVRCPRCNRRFCISHRHEEQHSCKDFTPIGARPSTVQQRTQSALSKLKLWAENKRKEDEKRRSGPKKSGFLGLGKSSNSSAAVSAQVELNTLKRAAKGDAKVPQEKRIYLHVEASSDTTKAKFPTGKFFYSKDVSVGRVLDMAAKALQVENVNNRGGGEEDKLRVFHVEAGRLLKFSEKIGDACQSGNMIVLLRGVGDGEPDLIDL